MSRSRTMVSAFTPVPHVRRWRPSGGFGELHLAAGVTRRGGVRDVLAGDVQRRLRGEDAAEADARCLTSDMLFSLCLGVQRAHGILGPGADASAPVGADLARRRTSAASRPCIRSSELLTRKALARLARRSCSSVRRRAARSREKRWAISRRHGRGTGPRVWPRRPGALGSRFDAQRRAALAVQALALGVEAGARGGQALLGLDVPPQRLECRCE